MVNRFDDRDPVEVLGEEFLDRRRRGEQASVQEYAAAYPELATEICRLFPTMLAMEQFKSCRVSSAGEPVDLQIEGLEQLGDYRIIREIGRGGMGVVFEAEQQSLGRRVAVKVFPRQALRDSRQLERFHREARTAASLHHTNIVPVFGVGEQDGLHYFVMQRIDGIALDEVVGEVVQPVGRTVAASDETRGKPLASASTDTSASSIIDAASEPSQKNRSKPPANNGTPHPSVTDSAVDRTRPSKSQWRWVANVGIQVAEAVAYAHAQGVLHRDIKPSNLLLDPQGTVWVTDFGLATFLQPQPQSTPADVAGTLRFMAPEHLNGEQDTRSDIYSLGLTLYELLTLRPAFDCKNRSRLIDKILKGDVAPPRTLRPEIPRDLEAIVLKAMDHEPKRRYENAAALADDLRRFVGGRPVHARRVGTVGRIQRWTRRNPAIAMLSAALLLVVVSSFALISAKWREAVAENRRAEDNLSLALESMDQILERFASSWMTHPATTVAQEGDAVISGVGVQMVVSDYSAAVLQDALKFYDQFAKQNATNPQLQRETAKVHQRVADIYQRLGQYDKAEQACRRCLGILDSQQDDGGVALAVQRAHTRNQLGLALHATSRFEEAEAEFLRAKEILSDELLKDHPQSQAELARTYNNLGQAQWLMFRRDAAKESHRQAIELLESLVKQYPGDVGDRLALARAYRTYYPFVTFGKQTGEAERIRSEGIGILEELVRDYPDVPDYQCELSEMLTVTSYRARSSKDIDQLLGRIQRGIEMARQLSDSHPTIPRYRAVLARGLQELARTMSKTRREDASMHFAESAALYRSLARDFADIPVYHTLLAMALRNHAENLRELGRAGESRVVAEEGVAAQTAYVKLRPDNRFGKSMLARLHKELAKSLISLDQKEEAEKALLEAERIHEQTGIRNRSRS